MYIITSLNNLLLWNHCTDFHETFFCHTVDSGISQLIKKDHWFNTVIQDLCAENAKKRKPEYFVPKFSSRSNYTPNGYIVPMEFRILFFPRISSFSRRTKMHLNEILLTGTELFKIMVPS